MRRHAEVCSLVLCLLVAVCLSCKKEERRTFTGTYTGSVQKAGTGWEGESMDSTFHEARVTISSKDPLEKMLVVTLSMGAGFHRRENTRTGYTLQSHASSLSIYTESSTGRFVRDSFYYQYSIGTMNARPRYTISVRAQRQ